MSREEEKLDQFLKNLISDSGLESPLSKDYVDRVMSKVTPMQHKSVSIMKNGVIFVGIVMYAIIGVAIYFLWQSGWVSGFISAISGMITPITELVSFNILTVLAVAIVFYLAFVRVLLASFFLRKRKLKLYY